MKDSGTLDKHKHFLQSFAGLCVVCAFGLGLLFALLAVITRGGWWFILLIVILIICLLCVVLYICLILFSLWLLKQPETVVLDEKSAREMLMSKEARDGDGVHIRFGRTK